MSFGNDKQPTAPTPPDPTQTARSAIQAEIDLGPQLASMRARSGVDTARTQAKGALDLTRDYGAQLGEATLGMREAADPALFGLERGLIEDVQTRMQEGLTPDQESAFRRRFAAEEAGAGRLGAPVGSVNLARQLTMEDYAAQQAAVNQALSLTGRLATPQGFNPQDANTSSNYLGPMSQLALGGYQTQAGIYNNQMANQSNPLGTLAGIFGGSLAGGMGTGIAGKMFPTK